MLSEQIPFWTFKTIVYINLLQELQNIPIMKTSHECEQEIEKGEYLKSSTCKESHVFRPFSSGNSGATTSVEQTLTYKSQKYESRKSGKKRFKQLLIRTLFDIFTYMRILVFSRRHYYNDSWSINSFNFKFYNLNTLWRISVTKTHYLGKLICHVVLMVSLF